MEIDSESILLAFFMNFIFSIWFYTLENLAYNGRLEVFGGAVLLGMGGSTLLINSLAMISEMIGENTVCFCL